MKLVYYVTFGRNDSSDYMDWEIDPEPGETTEQVLARAYDEIMDQVIEDLEDVGDEWSDGYELTVELAEEE